MVVIGGLHAGDGSNFFGVFFALDGSKISAITSDEFSTSSDDIPNLLDIFLDGVPVKN